jgi:hypothetical protein
LRNRLYIDASTGFIVLLVVLCLRFVIFETYIQSHKQRFRNDALQQNENGIKTLVMPLHQLYADIAGMEWKEQNRELIVNGSYHEVLRVDIRENDALVYIVEDAQENQLFAKFFRENVDQKNNLNLFTSFLFGLNFTSRSPATVIAVSTGMRLPSLPEKFQITPGHYADPERPPIRFSKLKA